MDGTLRERLAFRRQENERARNRQIVVAVNGFEDCLAAQYRCLTFEEKTQIAMRHSAVGEDPAAQVAAACDLLINACQDVIEVTGGGEQRPLGRRWSTDLVSELFGLSLPEGTTVRQAMLQAFDHEDLMDHFLAYTRAANARDLSDREQLPGESEPSQEG